MVTDPSDYAGLKEANASFYVVLKTWYNNITLWVTFLYALISLTTLVMLVFSYFTYNQVTMSKDVRHDILRRYILYFLILNIMELPNVIVVALRYKALNPKQGNLEQ